ncbi:MAG: 5-(carboxyamino)imidazole ribonucleotide mutase [Bacillota bacterium]|nr:5-(carboxyamino)imidazole ribonucleotide mutase [Bacillota bacterium]
MPKAAVLMGSDSDLPVLEGAIRILKQFGVAYEVRVISAHRTPDAAASFAKNAREDGIEVILAAAGKAAHLAGAIAANTTLPVIGIPIKSSLEGLDALLSTVQMPPGVPVATVGIDAGENAGLLAVQMLSIKYPGLVGKLTEYKKTLAKTVEERNKKVRTEVEEL